MFHCDPWLSDPTENKIILNLSILIVAISKIGNAESRNGERGMGNGEWGTGNGERGISKIGNI